MGELHHRPRWRRLRAHQLDKEALRRMCAAEGRTTPATVADHVVPHRNQGMPFWRGELQSLCASCHSSRERFIENRGYDNAIGSHGWPVDPRHPVYGGRKKCAKIRRGGSYFFWKRGPIQSAATRQLSFIFGVLSSLSGSASNFDGV